MTNDTNDIGLNSGMSIDFRQYAMLFWHWAWLIILAGVIVGGTTYYLNSRMTPIYVAYTRLLVSNPPASSYLGIDSASIVSGINVDVTTTYSQMLKDLPVLQQVIDKLNIPLSPEYLKGAISVAIINNTSLIQVSVADIDPYRAAAIANTLGGVFSERIQNLQSARYALSKANLQKQLSDMEVQLQQVDNQIITATDTQEKDRLQTQQAQYRQIYSALVASFEQVRLAEAQSSVSVVQVEPASVPYFPVSPQTQKNTLLATIIGMLVAMGLIFAIDLLDDTVRNPEELSRQMGLPILGVIPHHDNQESTPITQAQPRSPVAEAYRILRTNVEYANADRNLHRILVTSPLPEDGKTTVIANLAIVLSQRGLHTTLLDCDMRRPRAHRILGLQNRTGLSNLFLQPEVKLNGHVQTTLLKDLSLVSSGPLPPNPAELLGSQRMSDILDKLNEQSDMILIDTPPTLTVTDATVLAPMVDGILIVVKAGQTKLNAVRRMVTALHQVGARMIGIVVNDVQFTRSRYSYYYHSYYFNSYYYASEKPRSNGKNRQRKNQIQDEEIKEDNN